MGNRAIITSTKKDIALYMHWNGGRDTVEPLLEACAATGIPSPEKDPSGWSAIASRARNYLGDHVGLWTYQGDRSSPGDNGIYVIEDWSIKERIKGPRWEQVVHPKDKMLEVLEENMPRKDYTSPAAEDKHVVVTTPYPLFDSKVCVEIVSPRPHFDLAAICDWLKMSKEASPAWGNDYGWASFVQAAANYLGPERVRIGDDEALVMQNFALKDENSVLAFDKTRFSGGKSGWNLVNAAGSRVDTPDLTEYLLLDFKASRELLSKIDAVMPEDARLGEDFINGFYRRPQDLRIGDIVQVKDYRQWEKLTVVGFGQDRVVNGVRRLGQPVIDRYLDDSGNVKLDNPNNYIDGEYEDYVRVVGTDSTIDNAGMKFDDYRELAQNQERQSPSTLGELQAMNAVEGVEEPSWPVREDVVI